MSYEASPGYYGAAPQPQPRAGSGLAIAALVLGILALLSCWTVIGGILLGLVAVILGVIALTRARRGLASGRGMAIAGIVTGLLGAALSVALIAIGVSILNSDSGKNLQDCLDKAGDSQSARDTCSREYQKDVTG